MRLKKFQTFQSSPQNNQAMPTFTSELNLSARQSPKGHEDTQSPEPLDSKTTEIDQKKIDNITELFGKCFEIQVN